MFWPDVCLLGIDQNRWKMFWKSGWREASSLAATYSSSLAFYLRIPAPAITDSQNRKADVCRAEAQSTQRRQPCGRAENGHSDRRGLPRSGLVQRVSGGERLDRPRCASFDFRHAFPYHHPNPYENGNKSISIARSRGAARFRRGTLPETAQSGSRRSQLSGHSDPDDQPDAHLRDAGAAGALSADRRAGAADAAHCRHAHQSEDQRAAQHGVQ